MNIELKPFQENAARDLFDAIGDAKREIHRGKDQAIILSSPTGSGKTVILMQLLEWIWQGDGEREGDRKAVFLWLSDSPELNAQSRDKIAMQSSVFPEHDLVLIEPPFSAGRLEPGKIYFLNTQKLSKSSLLTKTGDGRDFTIWQTIENTVKAAPEHVYLVIDEAHRGTAEGRNRTDANSLMQRFIKGYPEGNMSPVPLIIGMSATPERFERLIEGTKRTRRPHEIDPQDVQQSGLLKEKIVLYHPDTGRPADWSLLEQATKRWQEYCHAWQKYCKTQKLERIVEPVLVIQVEDGSGKQFSKTNIEEIVKVVERVTGKLPDAAWTHAFQDDASIEAASHSIRKIDASKIENDGAVRIVLFKMSLSTGWDCPRAEVLMSFRKALDHTLIAQLVGRMVRTPLARSIEGSDLLNSVGLFLPHYDATGLRKIINDLSNPDPESGIPVEVQDGASLVHVSLDSKQQKCIERYQQLPSYQVERVTKISNVRRLVRFARYLAGDEIDAKELDAVKELIVKTLDRELGKLKKNATFIGNIAANEDIEIRETWVEYGSDDPSTECKTIRIKTTEENIEDLFSRCGRTLGEGLHMEFWRSRENEKKPLQSKLELVGLLMEEKVLNALEEQCGEGLQALQRKYDEAIRGLSTSARERYNALRRIAKEPEPENLLLPLDMEIKEEGEIYERHLYKDDCGKFHAALNKWETKVVREIIEKDKSVIAWLRILPRKDWALCIPYEKHNERHPLYPDIVAFRKTKSGIIVDLLDPHGTQLDDAVDKAKGLAAYARKHGTNFGRIDLIIVDDKDKLRRLNLNDESARERVDMVSSREHLVLLLNEMG